MKNSNVLNVGKLHNSDINSNLGVDFKFMPTDLSISNQLLFSNVNKLHLVMRVVDAIVTSHVGDKIHISCEPNDTTIDIYMGF